MKVQQLIQGQAVVTARIDQTLGEVAALMKERHVSGIPIVDEWGVLSGLVTASTIVEVLRGDHDEALARKSRAREWQSIPVREAMVTDLCTVDVDADVQHAARSMAQRRVHRAVVLGKDRNVLGVLSTLDVVQLVCDGRVALA